MKTVNLPAAVDNLGTLIGMVRSELVRAIENEMVEKGIDLRFTQYLILKRLIQLGPVSATELARAVELDGGAMTRQLDQLEQKGYLRRQPHAKDRRTLRIEITEGGAAEWQQLSHCGEHAMAAAQRSLSAVERDQLHDYLERVLHALRHKD